MSSAERAATVVAAARALVGVRFRLHGRSAATGLDCVGLAAVALERAGHGGAVPTRYGLRLSRTAPVEQWLREAGLRPVEDAGPGDLALVRPGPMQLHLMIVVPGGFVHAHAGLGRVVEMPGGSPWPVLGWWRPGEGPA
ncbi:peptidoglycan endopeptidase [Sphingobium ummariense]